MMLFITAIKPARLLFLIALAFLSIPVFAEEHHAHVHGGAKLQVAIDVNTVTMLLESPMDSLIGFEHAPGNEKEKAALDKMVAALNDPEKLFAFNAAAGCKNTSVKLESTLLDEKQKADENEKHEGHSDLDGELVFTCTDASKLTELTVTLFDIAENLQDLDVEIVAPSGQKSGELNDKERQIHW